MLDIAVGVSSIISSLSLKLRALIMGDGRWINYRMLMLRFTALIGPPLRSGDFLCLMLKKCEINLCSIVFLVGPIYYFYIFCR